MKKALKIAAVSAGIVSVVSAVVLGCIYLEDIAGYLKKVKTKVTNRLNDSSGDGLREAQ